MFTIKEKEYAVYMLLSIAATLVTLLIFLLVYVVINTNHNSTLDNNQKERLIQLEEMSKTKILQQSMLEKDLANYTQFYLDTREDFNALINQTSNINGVIQDIKNEINYVESENKDLETTLVSLEAQLK